MSALRYAGECLFLNGYLDGRGILPQRPVWEVTGHAEPLSVVIDGEAAVEWFMNTASYTADLVSLCMLCKILDPKIVFEIGTLRGSGALHLALNSPNAQIFTLDLLPDTQTLLTTTAADLWHIDAHRGTRRMFFGGKAEAGRIVQLYGDSAQFDFSRWSRSVDLFFIDGAHSYSYVRNDTAKALECCHKGSLIAWHDYGRFGVNGVSRWLNEFASQGRQIYRVPGGSLAYMIV
jgi:predicted O-methyltransferase YrrM